jgi:hypothetical protein
MVRLFAMLSASAVALALTGCEPPVASSTVANGPPGPPPPPAPVVPQIEPVASSLPAESAPAAFDASFSPEGDAVVTGLADDPAAAAGGFDAPGSSDPIPVSSAAPAATAPASAPAADSGSEQFISLSAGVALPQLLPEGTQIGVSVDYALRGEPKTSCRYFLVVESKEGEIPVPVKLDSQGGTIQGFLPLSVRPEHQPFRARIDEVPPRGDRVRVSNSAVLATSY